MKKSLLFDEALLSDSAKYREMKLKHLRLLCEIFVLPHTIQTITLNHEGEYDAVFLVRETDDKISNDLLKRNCLDVDIVSQGKVS